MKRKIKKMVIILLTVVIAITVSIVGARMVKLEHYKMEGVKVSDYFTITAHTGCMDTKENSLESIKCGVENGARIVEFDLYFNENGEPVLSHDAPKGGEVTLDEAFKYVASFSNISVNVDVKVCTALEKVYPIAQKYGIENRIFYTGINEDFVDTVKKNSSQVPYFLNVDVDKSKSDDRDYILSLVEKVKNAGAIGINFNYKGASKELVDIFHENGLVVSVWTVNSEYDMYRILSYGPDNITTRNPDKLHQIIS